MTRRKPRRSPPPKARARRDLVSPEVAIAYRAELLRRMDRLRDILAERARQAGWIAQPDGSWHHPIHSPNGVLAPHPFSAP